MKDTIEILLDRIVDLEVKLRREYQEKRKITDYLLSRGIVLTYWADKITSDLDDKEEDE